MERMTRWNPETEEAECEIDGVVHTGSITTRLAEYEDTGLDPEEIKRSDALLRGFIDLSRRHARTLPWIEKVMIADREGRLLVLPCKVGDELWIKRNGKIQCETIDRITVDQTDEDDGWYISIYTMSASVLSEDIGRLVFLSREDAEKALEGMGNDER